MSVTMRDIAEMVTGDRLPVMRATSAHLAVKYPFQAESGIIDPITQRKVLGLPVGYCGRDRSGGIFYFDPVQLYKAGIVEDTNVKILGKIGNRKSAGVKAEIYLGAACGYTHLVTDVKDEYGTLVKAIDGARLLRFGDQADRFINLMDPMLDEITRREAITAVTISNLGNGAVDIGITQKTLLWKAIEETMQAATGKRVPLLDDLVELLFQPSDSLVREMRKAKQEVIGLGYELALAIQRLTTGDLRGMFHMPTTPGLFDETPLLVLNFSKMSNNPEKLATAVTVLNFFTQSQWSGNDPKARFNKIIHDESWQLVEDPAFAKALRRSLKLGGTEGVSVYAVMHHLSNLGRSGYSKAIEDIPADTSTSIIYQSDRAELEASAHQLHLTRPEIDQIVKFAPGTAMYKFNERPGIIVEHTASSWPEVRKLVETRQKLLAQQD